MDPLRNLVGRAWEGLAEGWRELLGRSAGALTRFGAEGGAEREAPGEFAGWSLLAAETWETAQSVVIRVEIPGVSKEALAVDIRGDVLRIRGERRSGAEQLGRRYHLRERVFGSFERSIPLPRGVDAANAEVSHKDGVVTVILPKTEPVPPRGLPVSK